MTAEHTHTNALGRLSVWKGRIGGTIRTPTCQQYHFLAAKSGADHLLNHRAAPRRGWQMYDASGSARWQDHAGRHWQNVCVVAA
jgi:hypothetical protein